MNPIAGYMMTLVCGGILVSLIRSMSGETGKGLLAMICGIFMAFLVIAPLRTMDFSLPELSFEESSEIAGEAVRQGTAQAESEIRGVISRQTAAYILDQADHLGFCAEVQVRVDQETGLPEAVTLSGNPDPGQKAALTRIIEQELSIERGKQIWQQKTP